jgi:hypothetical protein
VRLRGLIPILPLLLGAAAPEEETPEARVLAAVARLREALQSSDRKALEGLIAPGFVMVHGTGRSSSGTRTWRVWPGRAGW